MSNHVEIEEFITPERVEYAYGLAMKRQQSRADWWADIGWRAAQERDPRLLKALEKAAEVVTKMDENQRGRTRRATEHFSEAGETTETQLFREAYRMADQGTPIVNLKWIYGAAAWLCGYNAA
jgi:tRNA A37 N6-isopentenylltransferase MiaA